MKTKSEVYQQLIIDMVVDHKNAVDKIKTLKEENKKLKDKIHAICFTQLCETNYCFGCEEHSGSDGKCKCIRELE